MTDPAPNDSSSDANRALLRNIILALGVWGVVLAIGAFCFKRQYDYRKPLLILACMGAFLGFWLILLRQFHRRRLK